MPPKIDEILDDTDEEDIFVTNHGKWELFSHRNLNINQHHFLLGREHNLLTIDEWKSWIHEIFERFINILDFV